MAPAPFKGDAGDAGIRLSLKRLSSCRKAIVSGIGGIAAVAISLKDPLGPVLPAGATPWLAVGVAFVTAVATYLTTNIKSDTAAVTPAAVPEAIAKTGQETTATNAQRSQIGTAVAGLALVVGGAAWASVRRSRTNLPATRLALLVRPSDFHAWLSATGDRDR